MFGIGSQELFIIFLVVLLLFGADKIPEVARAIGKSIREFKRAASEIETEIQQVTREKDILTGKKEARPRRRKINSSTQEPHPDRDAQGATVPPGENPHLDSEPGDEKGE